MGIPSNCITSGMRIIRIYSARSISNFLNESSRRNRLPDGSLNASLIGWHKPLVKALDAKPIRRSDCNNKAGALLFFPPGSQLGANGRNDNGVVSTPIVYQGRLPKLKPLKRKWMKYCKLTKLAFSPSSPARVRRKCHAFFLNISLFWGYLPHRAVSWVRWLRKVNSVKQKMKCMTRFIRCRSFLQGLTAGSIEDRAVVDPLSVVDKLSKMYLEYYPSTSFKDKGSVSMFSWD